MIALIFSLSFLVVAMLGTIWIARSEFADQRMAGSNRCPHNDTQSHRYETKHGWIVETVCHDCGRVLDLEWGDHAPKKGQRR